MIAADRAWAALAVAPDRATRLLSGHRDPWAQWAQGVVAASVGDYASAVSLLRPLATDGTDDEAAAVGGLAAARIAAVLRQLDEHDGARAWDEQAIGAPGRAATDGLIGRAADSVGAHDADAAAQWLARARPQTTRDHIRVGWVACEIALLRGDAHTATRRAAAAHELAVAWGSPRHIVKSALFTAAACRAHDPARASALLQPALTSALELGLDPLTGPLVAVLGEAADDQRRAVAAAATRRIADRLPPGHGARWLRRADVRQLLGHTAGRAAETDKSDRSGPRVEGGHPQRAD